MKADRCVTHHFACDCREAAHADLLAQVAALLDIAAVARRIAAGFTDLDNHCISCDTLVTGCGCWVDGLRRALAALADSGEAT